MAKKRKQKEEEKERPIFTPPKFDEKEFMNNEIKNSKVAILVFAYAIAFAIISLILTRLGQVGMALFLGILGIVFMTRIFEPLKIDLSHLDKKGWVGNYIMFIFAWLGIWIILCNPPFSDLAHPDVDELVILTEYDDENNTWNTPYYGLNYFTTGEWKKQHVPIWQDLTNNTNNLRTDTDFNITMKVTDNVGVDAIEFRLERGNGTVEILNMTPHSGHYWSTILNWNTTLNYSAPETCYISVWSKDVNGNEYVLDKDWDGNRLEFKVW